jgi:predicted Zn finger-like uncharacterized protein
MYTQCPNCSTVYRITEDQLKIAGGKVKCSSCAIVFNAMGALGDHGQKKQEKAKLRKKQKSAVEKESTLAEDLFKDLLSEDEDEDEAVKSKQERRRPPQNRPEKKPKAPAPPKPRRKKPDSVDSSPPLTDSTMALELEDLLNTQTITTSTIAWLVGSVALLLVAFIQYGYHHRLEFSQDVEMRDSVVSLCDVLGCELPPLRRLSQIAIKKRDVREQDGIPKTLLINLTIINRAVFVQPYPEIQITLFDEQSSIIGKRKFTPSEYLNDEPIIERGMPTRTPMHLVFDLIAPKQSASGFQFDFF